MDRERDRVKKILLLLSTLLVLSGCNPGGSGAGGASKTFDIDGAKVSFVAPPSPWVEKDLVDEEPPRNDGTMKDLVRTAGVSFQKPESTGFFSVGTMAQNAKVETDKSGKEIKRELIELENDQDTLDVLAYWVVKRDGEISKQEYIPVAGTNAFHMEFELGKPDQRMKGQQVHFTKDGTHWTLSMLMPSKDYSSEVKHFQSMVSSFKLEGGAAGGGKPAAAAKPAAAP